MAYDVPVQVMYGDPIETSGKNIDELMAAMRDFFRDAVG